MKHIVILFHHHESRQSGHFIHRLADQWRQDGLEVELIYGIKPGIKADLLIPHINLTKVPPDYAQYIRSFPVVVNRELMDISKQKISRNLLRPSDQYEGPVIVKTNNNFGGLPEITVSSKWHNLIGRAWKRSAPYIEKALGQDLAWRSCLIKYPIYNNLNEVPPGVFRNPALVCEKFLPEQEGDKFFMRHYIFLGDHWRSTLVSGASPLVKGHNSCQVAENLPVPEEVLSLREELGMDYGKIDYAIHQGQVVILDVNKTPGSPANHATPTILSELSPGIWSLLAR